MDRPLRVAVFKDVAEANRVIGELVEAGVPKELISVVCADCEGPLRPDVEKEEPAGAHTAKAAAAGGALGALLGGVSAAAGVALSGGTGLLVAGPVLAGSAGAVAGSFVGAMTTRGMEPEIADYYDQALKASNILVAVERGEARELELAEQVFTAAGAEPVRLPEG